MTHNTVDIHMVPCEVHRMTDATPLIKQAVRLAGSQEKLGEACGVSQHAIWYILKRGKVSAEMATKIDAATNGEVPRWKLRPDLWSPPERVAS